MNARRLKKLGLLKESYVKSSHYTHTSQPTHDIDLLQMLQGKDNFFRLPIEAASTPKKKNIIITDPTIALDFHYGTQFSRFDFSEKIRLWSKLKQQGFVIYVWTAVGLRQIVDPVSDSILLLRNMAPIHPRDFIKHLGELGIASEDCYVAGIEQTNRLLGKENSGIDFDNWMQLPETVQEQFYHQIFSSSSDTINLTVDKEKLMTLSQEESLLLLLEQYPNLHFHFLCTTDNDLSILLKSLPITKRLRSMTYRPRISSFSISWQLIGELLKSCPLLEELNLSHCMKLEKLPKDFFLSSTSLKKINLVDSINIHNINRWDWNDVAQILQSFPSLEELNLSDCPGLSKLPDNFLAAPSASLKKIHLSRSNLSSDDVARLLQCYPSIEELDLSYCENLGKIPDGFSLLSTSLTKLSLRGTKIDWNDVARLLQCHPSIEELDLSCCENLGKVPDSFSLLSTSLTKLSLRRMKIDWNDVARLLQCYPSIKELNLPGVIKSELPSDATFLSHLKFISGPTAQLEILFDDLYNIPMVNIDEYYEPNILNIIHSGLKSKTTAKRLNHPLPSSSQPHFNPQPKRLLDNEIDITNPSLTIRQVFENIHPYNHRCECYDRISITTHSIQLEKSASSLVKCKISPPTPHAHVYTGHIELNKNDWAVLPSLTTEDRLIDIHTTPAIDFEIAFNASEQLYYIQPKQPLNHSPVVISYKIEANDINQKAVLPKHRDRTYQMVQHFSFGPNGLLNENDAVRRFRRLSKNQQYNALVTYFNIDKKDKEKAEALSNSQDDGIPLLNTILKGNKGACRHRTMAFMALAHAFELPARAIYNACHAYVEIMIDGKWQQRDLGGAPANLHIIPPPKINDDIQQKDTTSLQINHPIHKRNKIPTLSADNPFRTWDTASITASSMSEYAVKLITQADQLDAGRKNALTIMDGKHISAFAAALLRHKKADCFYIADLNTIDDKQTVIDHQGHLREQDSALKQFLYAAKPGDVLLVNWSECQAKHMGHNSIMDDERQIKGMAIPEGVIVVGILDRHHIMGEDFYSRFRMKSDCPLTSTTETGLPPATQQVQTNYREVCFYDDTWRPVLLGQLSVVNGFYHLADSPLLTAIQTGEKGIILRNAPWDLPEFQQFISELLAKREINVNGQVYQIHDDFQIQRDDTPYPLEEYPIVRAYTHDISLDGAYVLNTMTFNSLFMRIQSQYKQLNTLPGLLAAHTNKTLTLFVTQSLSNLQWSRLMNEACIHDTSIQYVLAPGVRFPRHESILSTEVLPQTHVRVIETNDIDLVSDTLSNDTIIIPVNEKTTYADLTGTPIITKVSNGGTCHYACDHQPGLLTTLLQEGKKVVLKGSISNALALELSPLFLNYLFTNGERIDNLKGELTIITDKKLNLDFIAAEIQQVNENEKWIKLEGIDQKNTQLLRTVCECFYKWSNVSPFNYVALLSMLKHLQYHPYSNPLKPALRARADYVQLKAMAKAAWEQTKPSTNRKTTSNLTLSKQKPVLEKRVNKIEAMLANSWYVFVAGPSGVGKSTTINRAMPMLGYQPVTMTGSLKDKIKAWLQPGAKRFLFIDEANLYEPGELDVFEGLYSTPPKLLIDNVYYDVPKENRLIFAGNFGHFLGREELRFINRHGNVITFKEFDDIFLHHMIMQPLCKKFLIDDKEADEIRNIFIRVYHHVNHLHSDKHPLTARNLQMMVMRYANINNLYGTIEKACFAAYNEICGVLKQSEYKAVAAWIKKQFGQDVTLMKRVAKESNKVASQTLFSNFLITKKRVNPIRILQNLMSIRDNKIEDPKTFSHDGSNGLIIEGNPSIGKSSLAIEYLRAYGFIDGKEMTREQAIAQNCLPHQRYYRIESRDIKEIEQMLIDYFDEGACVIIDEMNTLPLEYLLNSLMSGVTPEGRPAKNPGFFVIGTQNPIHFNNRSPYSLPFLNRFQKMDLKDYSDDDLQVITTNLLGNADDANKLIDDYLNAKAYAEANYKLSPTPRDLFAEAKKQAVLQQRKQPRSRPGINTKNDKGNTQLHIAAMRGDVESVEALLEEGANIHVINHNGETPLDIAIGHRGLNVLFQKEYTKIIQQLHQHAVEDSIIHLAKKYFSNGTNQHCFIQSVKAMSQENKNRDLSAVCKSALIKTIRFMINQTASHELPDEEQEDFIQFAKKRLSHYTTATSMKGKLEQVVVMRAYHDYQLIKLDDLLDQHKQSMPKLKGFQTQFIIIAKNNILRKYGLEKSKEPKWNEEIKNTKILIKEKVKLMFFLKNELMRINDSHFTNLFINDKIKTQNKLNLIQRYINILINSENDIIDSIEKLNHLKKTLFHHNDFTQSRNLLFPIESAVKKHHGDPSQKNKKMRH